MRNLTALCLSLSLLSTLSSASAELLDDVKARKARGTLHVALEGTYPPFNYKEGSRLTGFDTEIAEALARQMGLKVQFVTTEWSGIIAGLQAGEYDVIVNQVAITPERQKLLNFSRPYVGSSAG